MHAFLLRGRPTGLPAVSLGIQSRLAPDCSPPLINSFPDSHHALPDKVRHSHTARAALDSSSPCIPCPPPPISWTLSAASLPAMCPASQNPLTGEHLVSEGGSLFASIAFTSYVLVPCLCSLKATFLPKAEAVSTSSAPSALTLPPLKHLAHWLRITPLSCCHSGHMNS